MDRGAQRPSDEGGGDRGEGILRVDFRQPGARLAPVDRSEVCETLEDRRLAFPRQDKTADGKVSRFFKPVRRGGRA